MTKKNNAGWFKKGASGNPRGRPKGAKNQATLLEAIVNALIPVTENGRKKMISKREAALIQLANKAAGFVLHPFLPYFKQGMQATTIPGINQLWPDG